MTTLLVSEIFPPKTGGSGRWFWEVYRRLPRDAYEIAAGEDPRQTEFDRTHDLRVARMPLTLSTWGVSSLAGAKAYWRAVCRLCRLVRDKNIQTIHCGRCLPEGLMARLVKCRTGVPYVCYAHGEEMMYTSSSRELSWLARRVLRGAEFVIANSQNTRAILTEKWGLRPERVPVLNPGVDTDGFVPAIPDPVVRDRLGWGDRPVVLTVGRLQRRKGHDMMIRAMEWLRPAIPEVLYAIVGDGDERQRLEAMVARDGLTGHVQFFGELNDSDLVRCYQQCDLFVLPNRQVDEDIEGFGMVLVEAQACGKPVVAGTSGGTAETMRVPETGRVVCCDGPHELARTVIELLADPDMCQRMGAAGRRWTVERFDWSTLSRRAETLFRSGCPAGRELLAGATS